MQLADAFIRSDLDCIAGTGIPIISSCMGTYSLGIEPITLALLSLSVTVNILIPIHVLKLMDVNGGICLHWRLTTWHEATKLTHPIIIELIILLASV